MFSLGYLKCTKNEGLGYTKKGYNNLIAGLTQKVLCMTTKELLNMYFPWAYKIYHRHPKK